MKLKSVLLFLVVALMLTMPLSAFAEKSGEEIPSGKDSKISVKLDKMDGKSKKTIITDKEKLKKIALEEGTPLEYNGKNLVRIEYEYVPSSSTEDSGTITPLWHGSYYTKNVNDYGHGWYNSTDDLYREFYIDGPDTFVINKTESYTTYASANFGASNSVISAGVSFSIGTEESVSFTSTTPVAADETLHAQLYTTYHKKSYDVWYDDGNGNHTFKGSGWAYKPTGTYIKKTFYSN